MGKIAEAYVEITAKDQGLDTGLKTAEQSLTGFVEKAKGLMVVAGIGMAAKEIASKFMEIANAGADLSASIRKSGVVFGQYKGDVVKMAEGLADKFGAISSETIKAATSLGVFMRGAGMSEAATAKLSSSVMSLADDVASFFESDIGEVTERIGLGMQGMFRGLHQWGIFIDDAKVKQEALRLGLGETTRELTEQEEAMARLSLITQALAKYQGAHEQAMGGFRAQIKMLKGEVENFKEDVGAPIAKFMGLYMQNMRSVFEKVGITGALHRITEGVRPEVVTTPEHVESIRERSDRELLESRRRAEQRLFEQRKFEGSGSMFGMFGQGFMERLMSSQLTGQINKEENINRAIDRGGWDEKGPIQGRMEYFRRKQEAEDEERKRKPFGGQLAAGGFEAFAMERQMARTDEIPKKQLDELRAMRNLLDKMSTGRPTEAGGMKFPAGAKEF